MRREYKFLIAATLVFVMVMLTAAGMRLPWNEDAVLYAIYGGAVGFFVAITYGMLVVWLIKRKFPNSK